MDIKLKLTKNEIELLIDALEVKLDVMFQDGKSDADKHDYGMLYVKLESILEKSLTWQTNT